MSNEIINRQELWGLSHYLYGEAYFGSFKGMRYRVAREPLKSVIYSSPEEKAEGNIKASIWPEPLAYGKTPPEEITDKMFAFTEDGLNEACAWLNEQYLANEEKWNKAPRI